MKFLTKMTGTLINLGAIGFYRTPWGRAYLTSAARIYRESDRWRTRVEVLGMDYADEAFVNSPFEIMWFKRLVRQDRKLVLKIIFSPYSCMEV